MRKSSYLQLVFEEKNEEVLKLRAIYYKTCSHWNGPSLSIPLSLAYTLHDARANENFFGKSFRYQLKFIIHCLSRGHNILCVF